MDGWINKHILFKKILKLKLDIQEVCANTLFGWGYNLQRDISSILENTKGQTKHELNHCQNIAHLATFQREVCPQMVRGMG